jgi:hypothetical protein
MRQTLFVTVKGAKIQVTQQARQLTWNLAERPESFRFLIRDRDQNSPTVLTRCFEATGSRSFARRFARRRRTAWRSGSCERFAQSVSTAYSGKIENRRRRPGR